MSTATLNVQLTWESCPPELLWIIFKQLSFRSLINCMTVNRRWKDVVVNFIEFYDLWSKIAAREMQNGGVTCKDKSRLCWKDIFINSKLWCSISSAQVKHHHTYTVNNLKVMHMYKDKLIVKTNLNVEYFDVKKSQSVRLLPSPCTEIDYTENDHMFVQFLDDKDRKQLLLYGKENPNHFSFNENKCTVEYNVIAYTLEGDTCYFATKENLMIWAVIWNRKTWHFKFRGRYYGSTYDRINAIHVYNKDVYILTNHGFIMSTDPEVSKLNRHVVCDIGPKDNISNLVLIMGRNIAVSVKHQDQRICVVNKQNANMALKCAEMTCATEHGEMMFLGFKDGVVVICRPLTMLENQGKPDLYLNVREFDKTITDPEVVALEVFEDKLSHHLFIATRHKIIQLLITYPFNIRTYYE